MPFQKITLQPGLNVQKTPLLNEGGWSSCNLIRFREGLPEVYGGWVPFLTNNLIGVPRGAHAYGDLTGIATMGVGTATALYVIRGASDSAPTPATSADITPIYQTTTPTNPFTTTALSATVAVSDSAIGGNVFAGSRVIVFGGTAVGGLTLGGQEYVIQTVTGPGAYTITASAPATGSQTGGGTPTLQYLLPTVPLVGPDAIYPRIWTIDNFGEDLIACPRGGTIYYWAPSFAFGARALPVSVANAPPICEAIFVSNGAEQIVALGIQPVGSTYQPMLVGWCASGDFTTWLASPANDAGTYPLTDGSRLMFGCRAAQQNLIWSDTALYSMQYIGGELIYGFTQLGTNCGLIAPQAASFVNGVAFWMSGLNFMVYSGTVQPLDCPVRDIVYKNLNRQYVGCIICSTNTQFNEVRWDYPSLNGTENDSYVIFNYAEQSWYYGSNNASGPNVIVARTAWVDINVFGNPIGFSQLGSSWFQETGYAIGGTTPMPWFLQSGEIDISPGEQMMFLDWVILDQILNGGNATFSIFSQRYSSDPPLLAYGAPFLITPATPYSYPRIRGRQIAVKFAGDGVTTAFWRLGAVRARIAPDGRN